VSTKDAVEVLHAPEPGLEGDLRARMIGPPEQIAGTGDAPAQDELDDTGPHFLPEETHQAAGGQAGRLGNHRERKPLAEVRLDEGDGATELRVRASRLRPGTSVRSVPGVICS
jgi:hypothetical protein